MRNKDPKLLEQLESLLKQCFDIHKDFQGRLEFHYNNGELKKKGKYEIDNR